MAISTTLTLGALAVSLVLLAYSFFLFVKLGIPDQTGSIATSSVDSKHFLLDLIAVTEPRVKSLLSSSPDELFVSVRQAGGPPDGHPQGVITAKHGDQEESVNIDLQDRSDLEPLFAALLGRVDTGMASTYTAGTSRLLQLLVFLHLMASTYTAGTSRPQGREQHVD
jgi:hypothetical protein